MKVRTSLIHLIPSSQRANNTIRIARPRSSMSDLTNLRNERTFPTFADCPEREVNLDFYHVIDSNFLKPKRHWCLLAEITEIETSLRVKLMIRDKAGVELPMFVFVEGSYGDIWIRPGDSHRNKEHFRVGHCVAILYPHRQDFLGGMVGIQHDVESWAKVSTKRITGVMGHTDIAGDSVLDGGLAHSQ